MISIMCMGLQTVTLDFREIFLFWTDNWIPQDISNNVRSLCVRNLILSLIKTVRASQLINQDFNLVVCKTYQRPSETP